MAVLKLARQIREAGRLPTNCTFLITPPSNSEDVYRDGQKTYILPGRQEYEYPYTSELFPFFYDKAFWTEYLIRWQVSG